MRAKEEIALLNVKMAEGSLPEDEPLFVLRAKDKYAARVVRYWIACCESGRRGERSPTKKLSEAYDLSELMDDWPIKQIPGRPGTRIDKRNS